MANKMDFEEHRKSMFKKRQSFVISLDELAKLLIENNVLPIDSIVLDHYMPRQQPQMLGLYVYSEHFRVLPTNELLKRNELTIKYTDKKEIRYSDPIRCKVCGAMTHNHYKKSCNDCWDLKPTPPISQAHWKSAHKKWERIAMILGEYSDGNLEYSNKRLCGVFVEGNCGYCKANIENMADCNDCILRIERHCTPDDRCTYQMCKRALTDSNWRKALHFAHVMLSAIERHGYLFGYLT